MATSDEFNDYVTSLDPNQPVPPDDVSALIEMAAPVRLWVLYNGDEESPAECRYFSDSQKAQFAGVDLVNRIPHPDRVRIEWRRSAAGPGLPEYAGPAPVVPRPELFPDYQALFEMKEDGTESFYWQLNSVLVDEPEPPAPPLPEPRREMCPDEPGHGLRVVIGVRQALADYAVLVLQCGHTVTVREPAA